MARGVSRPHTRAPVLAAVVGGLLGLALFCTPASASDGSLQGAFQRAELYQDRALLGRWQTMFRRLRGRHLVRLFPKAQAGARSAVRALGREQPSTDLGGRAKNDALKAFASLDDAMTEYERGFRILPPGDYFETESIQRRRRRAKPHYRAAEFRFKEAVNRADAARTAFRRAEEEATRILPD